MSGAPGVTNCDILVIGGGPAGSTAAALLAERGCDVVILERAQHPRFHIGESLLPANMPMLERMGLAKDVAAIGVFKPGAEFVDDGTGRSSVFSFDLSLNRAATSAYQVPRAAFDAILFDNARRKGARAEERICVTTSNSAYRADALLSPPCGMALAKPTHPVSSWTPRGATR